MYMGLAVGVVVLLGMAVCLVTSTRQVRSDHMWK